MICMLCTRNTRIPATRSSVLLQIICIAFVCVHIQYTYTYTFTYIFITCVCVVSVYRRGGIHLRVCLRGGMCFVDAQGSLSLSTHIHTHTHTHLHTYTRTHLHVCARGVMTFVDAQGSPLITSRVRWKSSIPPSPTKRGRSRTLPPLFHVAFPPLSDYLKGTLEKFDPPKPTKWGS
jgi:hypothetical protein